MPELDDTDPPNFKKYVEKHVTLDMLSNEELVQELINRQKLVVTVARRRVPRDIYTKTDFYSAMRALLSCDLATRLAEDDMLGEDVIQYKDYLEFSATVVILNKLEDDRPT